VLAWGIAALAVPDRALGRRTSSAIPERSGDRGERLVVAPADGKVVLDQRGDEPAFLHGARRASRSS
jgi:hypothetical protein